MSGKEEAGQSDCLLLGQSAESILLGKVGRRLLFRLSDRLLQPIALATPEPIPLLSNKYTHQARPAASALLDAVVRIALAAFSAAAVQPAPKRNLN